MWDLLLNDDSKTGLSKQVYLFFKAHILSGQMEQGEAMPSTRELADALHVSRGTVGIAYDMLWTEGYIVRRQGAPSRVAEGLRLEALQNAGAIEPTTVQQKEAHWDFRSGKPDLAVFPWRTWNDTLKDAADELTADQLAYSGAKGYEPLCTEIARWLLRARNMKVNPQDIFITSGSTQALYILVEILQHGGLPFALENPSHPGIRTVIEDHGIPILPMTVDAQGADSASLYGKKLAAAYLTPSHQFPLGSILPAVRRAELIRLAAKHEFYIIEDDYDSEYRYTGAPISPIYTMDPSHVIYVGTFSKTLFPALRIGFAVLPKALHKQWKHARTFMDVQNPVLEQAALAHFLQSRRMDRHIRQMRRLYGRKRKVLMDAIQNTFGDEGIPRGDVSGLHIALQFPAYEFSHAFIDRCNAESIRISPISRYCFNENEHRDTLLIGYGHLQMERIEEGIQALGHAVKSIKQDCNV